MRSYLFALNVDGIDVSDDEVVSRLGEMEEVVLLSEIDGVTQIGLEVTADTPEGAVRVAVYLIETSVPGATVCQIDLDLVAAADVAERACVSRQAVTNWAAGKVKGPAFPAPLGHVAGGTRVWAWSAVVPWLRSHGHGEGLERTLPYDLIVTLNGLLQRGRQPGRLAGVGRWEDAPLHATGGARVTVGRPGSADRRAMRVTNVGHSVAADGDFGLAA